MHCTTVISMSKAVIIKGRLGTVSQNRVNVCPHSFECTRRFVLCCAHTGFADINLRTSKEITLTVIHATYPR